MAARCVLVLCLAITGVSCASPRLLIPPPGPGTRTDKSSSGIYFEPTGMCIEIFNIAARVRIRGRVGGRDFNEPLWIGAQGYKPTYLRIEPDDSSSPSRFVVAGDDNEAALILPRERQMSRLPTRAAVEAALGIPLNADDLRGILTGCPIVEGSDYVTDLDDRWQRVLADDGDEMYGRLLKPGVWDFALFVRSGPRTPTRWRAEFHDRQGRVPRRVRLTSLTWSGDAGRSFDLHLTLEHIQVNAILAPDTFSPQIAGAQPVPLDDMKSVTPLASRYRPSNR